MCLRKLMGIAVGASASVHQSLNAAFLIANRKSCNRPCEKFHIPYKVPPSPRWLVVEPRLQSLVAGLTANPAQPLLLRDITLALVQCPSISQKIMPAVIQVSGVRKTYGR